MKKNYTIVLSFILICILMFACSKKIETNSDAILEKAFNVAKEGQWDKANELAEQAVNINEKNSNARTLYAITLEQCQDPAKALEEATQATMLNEDNFMAQFTRGRLLFIAERYDESLAPLEKANNLEQNNPQVLILLAKANMILGIQKKAVKYYIALLKQKEYASRPEAFNELGVLFLQKNDFKHALSFLKKAYSMNEKSIPTMINLAVLFDKYSKNLKDKGKIKTAKMAISKAIKYYRTALVYLQRSRTEESQQLKLKNRIDTLSTFLGYKSK